MLGLAHAEMSRLDQITKDEDLSARVVRKLDEIVGIPGAVTDMLLQTEGNSEQKLDLQVTCPPTFLIKCYSEVYPPAAAAVGISWPGGVYPPPRYICDGQETCGFNSR